MKRLLIIDPWHDQQSGANKSSMYRYLSNYYDIMFIKPALPKYISHLNTIRTFHPNLKIWKQRKGRIDETFGKTLASFRALTDSINRQVNSLNLKYDAILQVSSLFGPTRNPKKVPYISYHDSTVRNPEMMWPRWMPDEFTKYRDSWYALETDLFKSVSKIMTYSKYAKDTMVGEYGIASEKISVVGSAIKIYDNYSIDWQKRNKAVLFVSTDFERKGGYELISMFEDVADQVPGATLTIAGSLPSDIETLEKPWLIKLGSVSRQRIIDAYKGASVLAHPAKYDPFPSVILEAANFEIPCVASNICGIPEMIIDGKTGYLIEKGDKDAFKERIIYFLQNKTACMGMGKNAKKFVREKYHPEIVAKNVKSVIEDLLN